MGERIVTVSPSARTDGCGRFTVRVASACVARHYAMTTRHTLGFTRHGKPATLGPSGVPVVFDLKLARRSAYGVDPGRLLLAAP